MRRLIKFGPMATAAVVLLVAMSGLIGCASQPSPPAAPAAAPTKAAAPAAQPTTAPAAPAAAAKPTAAPAAAAPKAAAPAAERIVRFTMANTPKIDPAVGSDGASCAALANLYEGLVFPSYDGTIEPLLAEKWDISSDGLTYTFTLRKGAKFHNGKEVTADDVVFSLDRLLTIKQGFAYLFVGRVKGATAVDKYTVKFELSKPFGPFLATLVRLYVVNKDEVMAHLAAGRYGDKQDYGTAWLLANDAGSGPYKVKELRQNEYLLAEKFPDYWGGFKPGSPDGFKEIGSTEPVMVRTLISRNELEIGDEYQPMEAYKSFSQMAGLEVVDFATGKMLYFMLNNQKPPTDDIHVRRALAYAIPYDTLTKNVFPGAQTVKGVIPAVIPGSDPKATAYTYDLEAAKKELAQSKYAGKLDQYPIELAWVAEVPDREKIALAIQADAAKIGLNLKVTKVPWLSLIEMGSKMETTPANTTVVGPSYPEAGSLLESSYHSRALGSWENMSWSNKPEIDKLIEDAIGTIDRQQRFDNYAKAQQAIMETLPVIPVFMPPEKRVYKPSLFTWEPAERLKAGKQTVAVLGYLNYMRSIQFK